MRIGDRETLDGLEYELVPAGEDWACDDCAFFEEVGCTLECRPDAVWKRRSGARVYISGAIAHHDMTERKEAFGRAERMLRERGFRPVNPFGNGLPENAHWREHMRADIALLLECDYIYMLTGWEMSKGAKLEHDVDTSCGIRVLAYERTKDVL